MVQDTELAHEIPARQESRDPGKASFCFPTKPMLCKVNSNPIVKDQGRGAPAAGMAGTSTPVSSSSLMAGIASMTPSSQPNMTSISAGSPVIPAPNTMATQVPTAAGAQP
ncbi:hypothetical protein DNTS_029782 [Danionella cerebrum]|uniref:Uncharacterized protein n=1 Tax=Danionella cerebrum TaxID=2873325 RepID=A0A553QJE7_9TELE|nr:hypothetical protein DNTS_029782 [Danionella translucida]